MPSRSASIACSCDRSNRCLMVGRPDEPPISTEKTRVSELAMHRNLPQTQSAPASTCAARLIACVLLTMWTSPRMLQTAHVLHDRLHLRTTQCRADHHRTATSTRGEHRGHLHSETSQRQSNKTSRRVGAALEFAAAESILNAPFVPARLLPCSPTDLGQSHHHAWILTE